MSPALMALTMVKGELPADHPRQKTLDRGIRALKMSASIVEALLGFARSGARPAPGAHTPLGEAMCGALDEAAAAAKSAAVELRAEDASDGASAACAPGVLASVLHNLVDNGIKHMGGAQNRRVTVRAFAGAREVRIEVEDTGPGIPPDARATIFDPHVRLATPSTEGLGLGLATVKRLVDAHRGSVTVRSAPGCTCFSVVLPRAAGQNRTVAPALLER
jgi:signal transduction histidine kinase